jgi:hypothetical protein
VSHLRRVGRRRAVRRLARLAVHGRVRRQSEPRCRVPIDESPGLSNDCPRRPPSLVPAASVVTAGTTVASAPPAPTALAVCARGSSATLRFLKPSSRQAPHRCRTRAGSSAQARRSASVAPSKPTSASAEPTSGKPCTVLADCPGGTSCRAGTLSNYCVGGANDGLGCNTARRARRPGCARKPARRRNRSGRRELPPVPLSFGVPQPSGSPGVLRTRHAQSDDQPTRPSVGERSHSDGHDHARSVAIAMAATRVGHRRVG